MNDKSLDFPLESQYGPVESFDGLRRDRLSRRGEVSSSGRHKLPNGWISAGGEASRPLSNGGYYSHWFQRTLAGSNQHINQFLECQIDTANSGMSSGPTKHVIVLSLMKGDENDTWEQKRIATETIRVIDPNREASQRWTATKAFERAVELFEQHP